MLVDGVLSSSLDSEEFGIEGSWEWNRESSIASQRTGDDRLHSRQIKFSTEEDRCRSLLDHRRDQISSSNSLLSHSLSDFLSFSDLSPRTTREDPSEARRGELSERRHRSSKSSDSTDLGEISLRGRSRTLRDIPSNAINGESNWTFELLTHLQREREKTSD